MKHICITGLFFLLSGFYCIGQETTDDSFENESLAPTPSCERECWKGKRHCPSKLHKWMEKLKERNPEEYARVQQLRQDDLQAFREELRHRLDQRRFDAARHHDADFQERFKDLPPEMQERLENRFRDRPLKKSDGQYPEIKKLHQKTKQLSKDHRKTMDTDKREEIKAELKTTLEELFDMREAKRTKKLEALEKNIQHQKKNMEKRKGQRNEIIERRLQKLTDGDPLEW